MVPFQTAFFCRGLTSIWLPVFMDRLAFINLIVVNLKMVGSWGTNQGWDNDTIRNSIYSFVEMNPEKKMVLAM